MNVASRARAARCMGLLTCDRAVGMPKAFIMLACGHCVPFGVLTREECGGECGRAADSWGRGCICTGCSGCGTGLGDERLCQMTLGLEPCCGEAGSKLKLPTDADVDIGVADVDIGVCGCVLQAFGVTSVWTPAL
mmetsp:Transcript_59567/g.174258  ORF Transcript_59567/g.174258 Transcript_59567/m.174258 type:complete len:135 (-) Transcript_59567:1705-2109(-)